MHPAYSVIVFTTASGAGYGLLIWLAVETAFGPLIDDPGFGVVALGLAFALIATGLLSSTLHLGRPERAWRAFSQWRTSWLSREGVLALASFVPALVLALQWIVFDGRPEWLLAVSTLATVLLALATVACTGMIYQSLPTIRAWHQPIVTPVYVALALASGAVLLYLLLVLRGWPAFGTGVLAILLLLLAAALKLEYWRRIDAAKRTWTSGDATGLDRFGTVRVLDPPHSTPNFVMREMGYAVARNHATRLRRIALAAAFALPVLLLLASLMLGPPGAAAAAVVATLAMAAGLLVERWLFFAEAEHVVTVFYGRDAA
jgi:DMSO reductase anchor subunit